MKDKQASIKQQNRMQVLL